MTKKILGYECKFSTHVPTKHPDTPDVHVVKEYVHYDDGTSKPNLRVVKDYRRPFWVTLPNSRDSTQKKEMEQLENLREYECTQSELQRKVANALDKGWSRDHLRQLSESPYLYGSDMSSTCLLKREYCRKFPDLIGSYSVAVLDIETDVLHGTEDVIMASLVFQNTAFVVVLESYLAGFSNVAEQVKQKSKQYIGEYLDKHEMSVELVIAKDRPELITTLFNKAHEWQPDFVAIWNMDFDIPKLLKSIESHGLDPKNILCDPSVPYEFRHCKYREGSKKKVTSSGKVTPISPAAQWHTLECTSSFYIIDAMCTYKQLRLSAGEEPSYSLDAILQKELGIRKLKFREADSYSGLKWHQVMQTDFKLEYIVYNIFDCLSMIELDDKTKDLQSTLPAFAANTDFMSFKSLPKRIADALYDFYLDHGAVLGTVDGTLFDKEPEHKILGLEGWIVTLPSHMSVLGGNYIEEDDTIQTNIRTNVYDSDMVGAYPSCILAANVSKDTNAKDIVNISGIPETVFRAQNMNLMMAKTNSIEYMTSMFNAKKPQDLLAELM